MAIKLFTADISALYLGSGAVSAAYLGGSSVWSAGGGGWDISTASYVQAFSVADQEINPRGIFFKSDGLKMYVLGVQGDDVNEYSLSVAWDISTASYVQAFSVAAQEGSPVGLSFKSDGLKMYVLGDQGNDVNEYSLSVAWDISTASYVQAFSVATQDQNPNGIFFKSDGLKMYVLGFQGKDVNEYNLSVAWDISTASYVQAFSVAAQSQNPTGLFFKTDGLKMYMTAFDGDDVNEYSLSVAWDISTASYVQAFSVAAQVQNPAGLFFKPDGDKMYMAGFYSSTVNEYSL